MLPRNLPLPAPLEGTEPLAGDASSRRYLRLRLSGTDPLILAVYPPSLRTELRRDLEVLGWLADRSVPVPRVLAADADAGWCLQEDLGDVDGEALLAAAEAADRESLAQSLVQPLEPLAAIDPASLPCWNAPLDRRRLRWELAGFELWGVCHRTCRRPEPALSSWLDGLAAEVGSHPRRVCHRDYHLNNVLWTHARGPVAIDVQDVLVGPDTYDAVSFLGERELPCLLREEQRRRWLDEWARQTQPSAGWRARWPSARLQRGLKVLGTFARLQAAGRLAYTGWASELATALAPEVEAKGGPPVLVGLLLDWLV